MSRLKEFNLNGSLRHLDADIECSLLSVLRDHLGLTGAKYGCGEGRCGACTVLVEGRPVRSCTLRVGAVAGKAVSTIEGLEDNEGRLHPLQQSFLELGAMQCGYCTPGMIMAGVGLLAEKPEPTEAEIVAAMQGNLCRCGTYLRIVAAVRQAATRMKGKDR